MEIFSGRTSNDSVKDNNSPKIGKIIKSFMATPISPSAVKNSPEEVSSMLKDLDKMSWQRTMAVHHAVHLERCLDASATDDLSAIDAGILGRLLILACRFKHVPTAKSLLLASADPNFVDALGKTPLRWSIEVKCLEMVQVLLQGGADVHQTDEFGDTPMHWACRVGKLDIVQALLDAGGSPLRANKHGKTPVDAARFKRHRRVLKILPTS
jgi:ankyrin repeat protein